MIEENLLKIFHAIDACRDRRIADLDDVVAIKSVSGSLKYQNEINKMMTWIEAWTNRLKGHYECHDIGNYEADGKSISLPLAIFVTFGKDKKKKTICTYCRYDVMTAEKNAWYTDPWKATYKNRRIYGRGTCKGKGTLLSWFHCIEVFKQQNVELPVNIKFIIEGMSESGSLGLEEFLYSQKFIFLRDIDYVIVCESEWLTSKTPCICYGTVGGCSYDITCSGSNGKEFISYIVKHSVDKQGTILIPNIYSDVLQLDPLIERTFEQINCDLDLMKQNLPEYMREWSKRKILTRLWRQPTLDYTINEDECNEEDPVKCKFTLKIVSGQTPIRCRQAFFDHVKCLVYRKFGCRREIVTKLSKNGLIITFEIWDGSNIECKVTCYNSGCTKTWDEDITSTHYQAARNAVRLVFNEEPNYIRESHELPVVVQLKRLTGKNILVLPLSNNEMNENCGNECITLRNFIDGKKLLAAYLFEMGNN